MGDDAFAAVVRRFGADFEAIEVCASCGAYKKTILEHEPNGFSSRDLERIEYAPADDASLAWAKREEDCDGTDL